MNQSLYETMILMAIGDCLSADTASQGRVAKLTSPFPKFATWSIAGRQLCTWYSLTYRPHRPYGPHKMPQNRFTTVA